MNEPWERMTDEAGNLEPPMWFERFERYRLMGPSRSVLGCYKLDLLAQGSQKKPTCPPGSWKDNSERWDWQSRAQAWDAQERQRLRDEMEEERRKDKEIRIKLLKALRGKLALALEKLEPDKASWAMTIQGIDMVVKQLRSEYDDEPTSRMEVGGMNGGPIEYTELSERLLGKIDRLLATSEEGAVPTGTDG